MKYVFSTREVAEILARHLAHKLDIKDGYAFNADFNMEVKKFPLSSTLHSISIEFIEEDR